MAYLGQTGTLVVLDTLLVKKLLGGECRLQVDFFYGCGVGASEPGLSGCLGPKRQRSCPEDFGFMLFRNHVIWCQSVLELASS